MNIREFTLNDKKACVEIFKSNIPTFFLNEEIKIFEDFLETNAIGAYWVLENSGHVIACGGIGTRDSEGRLHFGIVHHSLHKQGVGSKLLQFRLAKLIENPNVKAISLDTSQHNPKFFNKFGFEVTKITENYYGPNLHRFDMRWELPTSAGERKLLAQKLSS
jgi:[ribosomal protein S18]-alanine N-acetyltransferase